MPSVEEILAAGRKLTLEFKSKKPPSEPVGEPYVEPPIFKQVQRKYFEVLAPVGFEWGDTIMSYYPFDAEIDGSSVQDILEWHEFIYPHKTIVVHGHLKEKGCSLPAQCHVLGYRPTGEEPKPFLENWRRFGYEN